MNSLIAPNGTVANDPVSIWVLLLAGCGLWLFIEGAIYAIAPSLMKKVMRQVSEMSPNEIMTTGLISSAIGFGLLYVAMNGL